MSKLNLSMKNVSFVIFFLTSKGMTSQSIVEFIVES